MFSVYFLLIANRKLTEFSKRQLGPGPCEAHLHQLHSQMMWRSLYSRLLGHLESDEHTESNSGATRGGASNQYIYAETDTCDHIPFENEGQVDCCLVDHKGLRNYQQVQTLKLLIGQIGVMSQEYCCLIGYHFHLPLDTAPTRKLFPKAKQIFH